MSGDDYKRRHDVPTRQMITTCNEADVLRGLRVGSRVWFYGERIGYTVQARSDRFIVCNKPFALRRTVLYTVIDCEEQVRGTENLIFGFGAETREECERMVTRLEGLDSEMDSQTEVSHRNRVPLHITKAAS